MPNYERDELKAFVLIVMKSFLPATNVLLADFLSQWLVMRHVLTNQKLKRKQNLLMNKICVALIFNSPQEVTGQLSPQTHKFKGSIACLPVMVLVDMGNTQNIMQSRNAHLLNLKTTLINQFSVMLGNGSHLQCEAYVTIWRSLFKINYLLFLFTYYQLKGQTLCWSLLGSEPQDLFRLMFLFHP